MGLQLSVLFGCVGAIELLACLKHVVVCKMQLIDDRSHCEVRYFHRAATTKLDDFVIVDKAGCCLEEDERQGCSEIEAIFRQNKAEPNVLCIGPSSSPCVEGYVRIPTPIPFGMDDEPAGDRKSSSNSSLIDSGNENPMRRTPIESQPTVAPRGSSSDVSSLEDTENNHQAVAAKKIVRRSRTPEVRGTGSYEDYDEEEEKAKPKSKNKSLKPKSKQSELRRSAENLATARRSKRQRDPERCKSDIQVSRNALRDEWTNTSPIGSEVDLSSKKSISVLIQTSFEDKLRENAPYRSFEASSSSCPNCRCKMRKVAEVDGKPQLVKVSSFEEASDNDYTKLRDTMAKQKKANWKERVKSSVESESLDEYLDAEEEGMTFCEQPIQYSIPDHPDSQAFWVIASSSKTHSMPDERSWFIDPS